MNPLFLNCLTMVEREEVGSLIVLLFILLGLLRELIRHEVVVCGYELHLLIQTLVFFPAIVDKYLFLHDFKIVSIVYDSVNFLIHFSVLFFLNL
jgi:hypothetical protein